MNKTEFFSKLNSKLSILNEKERRDIIEEYSNHIEFKMQDGKTEEQAIADFGDIDSLVEDILEAYHINQSTVSKKNFEYYVKLFFAYINKITEKILSLSMKDITRIAIEFLVVLFIIFLISLPFEILRNIVRDIFYFLPHFIRNIINSIIDFIFNIINLAIGIMIVYNFIKTRVMCRESVYKTNSIDNNSYTTDNFNSFNYSKEYISDENKSSFSPFKKKINNFDMQTEKPLSFNINTVQTAENTNSIGKSFFKFIVCILKVLLFLTIWLPFFLLSIIFIISTVVFFLFMITQHIGLWGVCIAFLGCSVICVALTFLITDIIFSNNKNSKNKKDNVEEIEEI